MAMDTTPLKINITNYISLLRYFARSEPIMIMVNMIILILMMIIIITEAGWSLVVGCRTLDRKVARSSSAE